MIACMGWAGVAQALVLFAGVLIIASVATLIWLRLTEER